MEMKRRSILQGLAAASSLLPLAGMTAKDVHAGQEMNNCQNSP